MKFLVEDKRVKIYAFVIMPNHIHLIWYINDGHKGSDVQQSFLKFTAQQIKADLQKNNPLLLERFKVNAADRQYQFWERNPLSVGLYTDKVFKQKLEYIHNNPVQDKWKSAQSPEDYFYSSAKFYYTGKDDFGFLSHYMYE